MKKNCRWFWVVIFFLLVGLFLPGRAFAVDTPAQIFYQGRLTDDTGVPLEGSYDMRFTIYDSADNTIWGPRLKTVPVDRGVFGTYLNTPGMRFNQKYWIGVEVYQDGQWNSFPQTRLSATPYAFNAFHIEGQNLSEIDWPDVAMKTTDVHKSDVGLTDVQNLNQAELAGNQLQWTASDTTYNVIEGSGSGLDADLLDGRHAGNQAGSIPINNGTLNQNLNAELIEGKTWSEIDWGHLAIKKVDVHKSDVGLTDVQNINQANMGGTNITWDSTNEEYNVQPQGHTSGLNADKLDGYHASNSSGDIPVSNGSLNSNLNADYLDGQSDAYYKQGLPDVLSVNSSFSGQNMNVGTDMFVFYDNYNSANVELTTSPGSSDGYGLAVRTRSNPGNGDAIFRVLSAGGSERLRVEHNGRTETSNAFHAAGSISTGGSLNMNGGAINNGGNVNFNDHSNGRLILPVGSNKYATN